MNDNTVVASNGVEVYTGNMFFYADEYIDTLRNPDDIYTSNDIVNITLHFFLKDIRPMQPPAMNHSIAVS